jgi:Flp pilus assembly pilin Flp
MSNKKSQSFLEYATLMAIIAIALVVMSAYTIRGVNARFANIWADLYDAQNGVR